jgi:hypothetical protein
LQEFVTANHVFSLPRPVAAPTMARMDDEIIRADRRLRAVVIGLTVLLVAGGLVGLAVLYRRLEDVERLGGDKLDAALVQARFWTTAFAWLAGLSFAGIGAWFVRLAVKVLRSGRYPPPGWKVIQDTRVRTGRDARRIALGTMAAAVILAAVGVGCAWYLHRLAVAALAS